ncbi:hypothetical protein TNCV_1197961 [Trichonephila clavipes]|uniref:Uncharacterized protein n=1 Tax=Trichonephila clavipes TaxID=2585209 RepID=A0A8X6S399_TRICX|nr:hypothetical protein TNCV_1197961 [Trichonephila clavipes]
MYTTNPMDWIQVQDSSGLKLVSSRNEDKYVEKLGALLTEEDLTACLASALLPKRLPAKFLFKAGHLVLALSSNRTPDLRNPGNFVRIASFDFDRVSQYRVASMVPTSRKSSKKNYWAPSKRSSLPAEGVVLNLFRTDDDGFFHSIEENFASGVKWWTHDSSLFTIQNRKSLASSWKVDDMVKANRRITIHRVAEELGIGRERAQEMQSPEFSWKAF